MNRILMCLLAIMLIANVAAAEQLIADFEGWPNSLGGEIGVYGSCEPDWATMHQQPSCWIYEPVSYGYDVANVHAGKQAWRLITGTGSKPDCMWGSFAMDLGPTTDLTVTPKRVESLDASKFSKITFWVKGAKGGEKMKFLVRDAHALSYFPQEIILLKDATMEWEKVTIFLKEFKKVDLTCLDSLGIDFGTNVGNLKGDVIYLDDFCFE